MLYLTFQKVEGEMTPVILTAFNNQPVDAILKEKEVWELLKTNIFVGIAIIVIKPISFLGDNVLFFFYYYNLRVKSKEMPEAGKVSNVFEFSDIV